MLSTVIRGNLLLNLPEPFRPAPFEARNSVFQRKIRVDFSVRGYRVKTIESDGELKQVLRLRRAVFHREFAGKIFSFASDRDGFDEHADHLAIFDERSGRIAGVYRLITSEAKGGFYSATEFDLAQVLALPGKKLELSRACIHRASRNGVVIALLWKGIAAYAKAAGVEHLFGLSSISTTDKAEVAAICRYFERNGLVHRDLDAEPRAPFAIPDLAEHVRQADGTEPMVYGVEAASLIPPLFRTYIKAGAKVCSRPVIDRDFRCADWLTVLDLRKLSAAFERRFMQD